MGRGGGGSGGSHGGGHFNYGSSRGGGRSSSNYSTVYRTSYYRPMTPLGGTLSIILAIIVIVAGLIAARPNIQQRSKLDSSLCTKVDTWYQDDINWIHYSKVSRRSMTRQEYSHICGLPTISTVRQNQTPVTLKQL